MSNPQHLAEPNFKTMFTEPLYAMQYGQNTPDRNGKHRAVEAFNPMTGITTTFKDADA